MAMIEIATGAESGTVDSEAYVALCLVFEKLGCHQIEVLCGDSPVSSYITGPDRPGQAWRGLSSAPLIPTENFSLVPIDNFSF